MVPLVMRRSLKQLVRMLSALTLILRLKTRARAESRGWDEGTGVGGDGDVFSNSRLMTDVCNLFPTD